MEAVREAEGAATSTVAYAESRAAFARKEREGRLDWEYRGYALEMLKEECEVREGRFDDRPDFPAR